MGEETDPRDRVEVVQAGERRSARLESLRAVAALAVLLSHVFAYSHGWRPVIYQGFFHRAIMGGGFGVQLFFALSGYLLYRAFTKRDFAGGSVHLATYARNRALRILPLYYVVVVVLLVFTQHGGTWTQWWRFSLFAEEFSTKTAQTVDGPMWSLVVEIMFYILLPTLAWGLARASRGSPVKAVLWLLALGGLSAALHQFNPAPTVLWSYSFPSTFYGFVPGMILAILEVRWKGALPRLMTGLVANSDAWVAASVILWLVIFWRYSLVLLTAPASFLLVGACVLPLGSKNSLKVLDWRPLALVGVASYSLYLWHVPIIEHLAPHAPRGTIGLLVIALPLCLAVAAISYGLVERTALRFRRRWSEQASSLKTNATRSSAKPRLRVGPSLLPLSDRGKVALLLAMALLVRLIAIVATRPLRLSSDPADYDRLGRLIAAAHGFGTSGLSPSGGPTAFRAPLYPSFLGFVYKLTGGSVTAARVCGALLGVGTVALIGLVAYLLWGRRAGWIAGGIAAVLPSLVTTSTALLSESIYLPLEMLAVASVLLARRAARHRYLWLAAGGASAGLGVLARPNGAVLVLGLAALIVLPFSRAVIWSSLRQAALLGAVAVLVVTPWEVRNAVDFHKFVPISTIDGYNLAGVFNGEAANDKFPQTYQWRPPVGVAALQPLFKDRRLNEATLGDRLWSSGTKWLENHPAALPEAYFWNTFRMIDLSGITENTASMQEMGFGKAAAAAEIAAFWLLAALALIGIAGRRTRGAPWSLWITPILFWLITTPFLSSTRIRTPIDPFIVICAALGVVAVLDRIVAQEADLVRDPLKELTPSGAR